MGRSPCCSRAGLNRGAWTPLEDKILTDYITAHGEGKWRSLPKRAGLKRCGKSCRLRWLNYLRPDIKRGNITPDEEDLIIRLHKLLGNRWSLIAGRLPGRTDNEIKNYWNTNIGKRLQAAEFITNGNSPIQFRAKKNSRSTKSPPDHEHLQNEGSSAVRTKASRCSKIFINSELQSTRNQQLSVMPQAVSIKDTDAPHMQPRTKDNHVNMAEHQVLLPEGSGGATLSPDNSAEILGGVSLSPENLLDEDFMDFVVDDDFLSGFLRDEFFMPPSPPSRPPQNDLVIDTQMCIGDNSNFNVINTNVSSPNPCGGGLLFSSSHELHEQHDELLGLSPMNMLSFLDSCTTLDCIQDQPKN